ncbi:MAG: ankyrin repeat domain-containing protein, partial [Thermus sp.]|uniref:ankyrin repeat domain-containing protein n=1 Tax=Thermus sp. TaxID=275 RepID=UPI00391C842E
SAILVKLGSDVNARNEKGFTPLHDAARTNPDPEVISTLVELGADVNARGEKGITPLHLAAFHSSNPDIVLTLLELGADHQSWDLDGKTPWDLIQRNEKLKNTPAYWRLNDLRF